MRLRSFGHACVRIETAHAAIVIDPGEFSDPAATLGASALLFTHGHYDHLSVDTLRRARDANTDLEVWAPEGAAGACGVDRVGILRPGQTVLVAGVAVAVSGGRHASVQAGQDAAENVALLVDGRVCHPGDSLTVPAGPVKTLLVPIVAPWSRVSEVVDYLAAVRPARAIPVHDALLSATGMAVFDRNIAARSPGLDYRRLGPDEWCDA